jgi:hypothetical protein
MPVPEQEEGVHAPDRSLHFIYTDSEGKTTERHLTQWKEAGYCVTGFCLSEQCVKTFRKDRVTQYLGGCETLLQEPFPSPPPKPAPRDTSEYSGSNGAAQLLGIIEGVAADGQLHDLEIIFLRTWLTAHKRVVEHWLGHQIMTDLDRIMSDGVITEDERMNLLKTLQGIIGLEFAETGAVTPDAIAFPADHVEVVLKDAVVCLTGKFDFGSRKECEVATAAAGAMLADSVTKKVRYLVIGSAGATKSWKHEAYGAKIDAAMKLKEKGHPIWILDEKGWRAGLGQPSM